MRSGIMDCSEVVYEAIFEGKEKKGFGRANEITYVQYICAICAYVCTVLNVRTAHLLFVPE